MLILCLLFDVFFNKTMKVIKFQHFRDSKRSILIRPVGPDLVKKVAQFFQNWPRTKLAEFLLKKRDVSNKLNRSQNFGTTFATKL